MELMAAIIGAMVGITGMGVGSVLKRNNADREAIVKLSMGIEHIGRELEAMRVDFKEDRYEIFGRLRSIEERVSIIEVQEK